MRTETEGLVLLGQAGWSKTAIEAHIREMSESAAFRAGDQSREILNYLIVEAFEGRLVYPKDIAKGPMEKPYFGKGDTSVRLAMWRLRERMEAYYAALPKKHGIRLLIPDKTYLVLATRNDLPQSSADIPAIASILEPAEGAEVSRRITVCGRIDSLDPDTRPWLIVYAPDNVYYPQLRVSRRSPSWEGKIFLGTAPRGESDGAEFDIVLAAANVDGDFALETYMRHHGDGYSTRLPDTEIIATRRVIRRDIRL